MQEIFNTYISEIAKRYSDETTSEIGYRTPFENLLKEIFKGKNISHDARVDNGNKPDFIIHKNNVPLLYIETKDIGLSLDKIEKSSQLGRYFGYANLVLTDYLEFRFYRNGLPYGEPIIIGEYNKKDRSITPIQDQYERLSRTLIEFTESYKEPIKSGLHLAKIMGGKAQRIRDDVREVLKDESDRKQSLEEVYEVLKSLLVHDLTPSQFADMYAQTLVYGLFVARYYDKTENNFTRQEAIDLLPESNPFLRNFFDHIAGPNFDKKLEYIVNELCDVFSHADVEKLMEDYYKKEDGKDPVIHFYEDFLNEYDPELRKKMGAYYTPQPVVNFIVRSVDHILKRDFKIPEGLADSSKYESGQHKVQILDPATGTGTFLSTTLNYIYGSIKKSNKPGRWDGTYIHYDLLPRIHGFELMMTPYTIAHLKVSMAFAKTGFKHFHKRFGIYLTNSLEKTPEQQDLLALGLVKSISEESKEANKIKEETPIMVVLGNPPYSVSSSNKGEWIQDLIKVYKKDLNEKKINLDDDYIKFIRFAENLIERNGIGIVAMITNNSFIDGITHRQMRKHLLETFDDIYILDLHGNSKKKEVSPDGSKDENVFDIMQGVSINIFVKKNKKKELLGKVHHIDLYGTREKKFEFLTGSSVNKIKWNILDYKEPYYFFVPRTYTLEKNYLEGFSVKTLFVKNTSGIVTSRDSFVVDMSKRALLERIKNLREGSNEIILRNTRDWNFQLAREKLISDTKWEERIVTVLYRPLDLRYLFYADYFLDWPRKDLMPNLLKENLALITTRQFTGSEFCHIQVTKWITEYKLGSHDRNSYVFPLYLYSDDGTKTPNLNTEIVNKIEEIVGKTTPEDIFDYIYAVLHSPKYREKYKEFLKIDFPRIPYPKDKESFKKLVKIGKELRELHLMESPKLDKNNITYPISGSGKITKVEYKDNKVYINKEQYFGNVPEIAWNFYIGGYQPAQKWLKDRKGRVLSSEDIDHYAKIITILIETYKITQNIDNV